MIGQTGPRPDASAGADGVVELAYPGQTPIATCHWRWIANTLAMRGHPGYWESLGLAWGARWTGGEILFGSMTWPIALAQATGIVVDIRTFPTAVDARAAESGLADRHIPVIVEVDGSRLHSLSGMEGPYGGLPTRGFPSGQVVKAVLVTRRGPGTVRILDAEVEAGPRAVCLTIEEYEQARAAPCHGRAEPFKLYALMSSPDRQTLPKDLLDLVRRHLQGNHAESQRALAAYTRWVRDGDGRIDVCRVAGERYQATRLFEHLAAEGVPAACRPAELFGELTDAWYTLHLLATHERAEQLRPRLVRLLEQLAVKESAAAAAVLE